MIVQCTAALARAEMDVHCTTQYVRCVRKCHVGIGVLLRDIRDYMTNLFHKERDVYFFLMRSTYLQTTLKNCCYQAIAR